ncbi:MAG: peptidoglycan DD-metalloendopeptidase family protein [Geobacteraceae bacterium]
MSNPPRRPIGDFVRKFLPVIMIIFIAAASLLTQKLLTGSFTGQHSAVDVSKKSVDTPPDRIKTSTGTIHAGETISSLLGNMVTPKEIHALASEAKGVFPLSKICAGSPYRLISQDGDFKRFSCDIDDSEQLVVVRKGDGFSVSREKIPYTVELVSVQGTIDSSLFESVVKIGESEQLAMKLADIFAWDIDFFKDIQPGDSFEVVLEKRFRDGKPAGDGRVLAARFTNQDRVSQAFYFKDGKREADYYDENGHSLRKAFLKAPLSYSRISSGFSYHRLHPITHRIKAHPAIDYAAPTGTPIHTVCDGTVIFAAYKRYNGNCVKVRHPNGWVTMYNHMSKIARSMRPGKRVAQGQVIGYVGSTGLATGPHLDFRMYKHGVPVNPLKVKSPPARPVSATHMAAFKVMVADRVAMMESSQEQKTARAHQSESTIPEVN